MLGVVGAYFCCSRFLFSCSLSISVFCQVFGGGAAYAALNIPSMKAHLMEPVRHLLSLADKLGSVAVQLTPAKVKSASLEVSGVADGTDLAPLTTYFYKGLLSKVHTGMFLGIWVVHLVSETFT